MLLLELQLLVWQIQILLFKALMLHLFEWKMLYGCHSIHVVVRGQVAERWLSPTPVATEMKLITRPGSKTLSYLLDHLTCLYFRPYNLNFGFLLSNNFRFCYQGLSFQHWRSKLYSWNYITLLL